MKSLHRVAVFFVGLFLVSLPNAIAQSNPTSVRAQVKYFYQGRAYTVDGPWYQVGQDPAYENYDGCQTSMGNEFQHAHFPHGFPLTDSTNHDPPLQVTAAMCDDYWDQYYWPITLGGIWEKVSGATMASNCHGYATGRSYCVQDSPGGMGVILADEWTLIADGMPKEPCIHSGDGHSWKILTIWQPNPLPPGWPARSEKHRMEKNGTSGVYQCTFPSSGTVNPDYYEQQ